MTPYLFPHLRWIDPADGHEIKTEVLSTPLNYLAFKLPPVKVDLACRMDRIGPYAVPAPQPRAQ